MISSFSFDFKQQVKLFVALGDYLCFRLQMTRKDGFVEFDWDWDCVHAVHIIWGAHTGRQAGSHATEMQIFLTFGSPVFVYPHSGCVSPDGALKSEEVIAREAFWFAFIFATLHSFSKCF
eukprot:EG_transcript_28058